MIQATCMHDRMNNMHVYLTYSDNIPVPLLVVAMDDSELVPTLHCSDILW